MKTNGKIGIEWREVQSPPKIIRHIEFSQERDAYGWGGETVTIELVSGGLEFYADLLEHFRDQLSGTPEMRDHIAVVLGHVGRR